ncbi:MAG: hypothetical protein KAZ58_02150 [Arenimonas sp.]|nr:hypothetical protein [Arenimonas sp.]
MNARINHQQLLRFAGLLSWIMVGIPLMYAGWQGFDQSGLSPVSVFGWTFSYLAFGVRLKFHKMRSLHASLSKTKRSCPLSPY